MENTPKCNDVLQGAIENAIEQRKEYLTPEFLLGSFVEQTEAEQLCASYQTSLRELSLSLDEELERIDEVPKSVENYELLLSSQMQQLLDTAVVMAESAGRKELDVPHLLHALLKLEESAARYLFLRYTTTDVAELMSSIVSVYNGESLPLHAREADDDDYPSDEPDYEIEYTMDDLFGHNPQSQNADSWRNLVTCINDLLKDHNPLIGREEELARTIQVLCRKDKNNPLHIGESGVGKTALVYGLAALIESGKVPQRLKGAKIYQMDMGAMVAGTSYRGDFEKKVKSVMDGVLKEGNSIVYIDEIHTLVGAGSTDGSLDGSNMLKPYLEAGQIRFIGSTTYQEYNKYFQKSKGLVRRFQQIDIPEPSVEETIQILEGLQDKYETFHGVKYAEGVMAYAVEVAAKRISDRFLPDKAIDLIDEAGAYRQLHPLCRKVKGEMRPQKVQWVDTSLINDVLARICKIDPKTLDVNDNQNLETLETRIKSNLYGQDEAVKQIVEAVQMGKAGLLEEGKPVASFLFVGPTGVGKTEVCKVLAKELGIEMVRFDMSEYAEKHAVAKLIGSPAGYVGYEDGGLLTDAIRKTPHCVLLLDEIEKAHADIYNILLQVMDYASLTDNKGQKADFRHVILVMTSNAGAQFAHQASIGFGAMVSAGTAMLQTVKKTFKPEFLARLSATVVFHDMHRTMAGLILDKKLRQLSERLEKRQVTLSLTPAAHDLLLTKGYTPQNGAREMDRQINQLLSPVLMRAILFGGLKSGGEAVVDAVGDELKIINV